MSGDARMDDLRQVFASNLRRIRHEKGLSQDELARKADMDRSYLSRLENGANSPGLEIIGRLATVLRCEPAELLKQ